MAQKLLLLEGGVNVKPRSPVAVAALTIATLGIYGRYWYYKVNREMRDFGRSRGDRELADLRPWRSLLAVTLGGLIVVPELVSYVRTARRVQIVEQVATGAASRAVGLTILLVTAVLLPLDGYVHIAAPLFALGGLIAFAAAVASIQARLNAAWQTSGASEPIPA